MIRLKHEDSDRTLGSVTKDYAFFVVNAADSKTGKLPEGLSVADETRICVEKLEAALGKAGLTLNDLAKCNSFLAEDSYRKDFWGTYNKMLAPGPYPARCTFVTGLPSGCRVQIDAVAVNTGA
jgi:2-iminobutanoate/2-iminopropanoate deaminase